MFDETPEPVPSGDGTGFRPSAQVMAAAELFRALSSPLRIELLRHLAQPTSVGRLVELTASTQPLVSQHLRVLRGARLVSVHRSGREALYQVADHHIHHVIEDAVSHAARDD